ncbi:TonB-dependent receptor [Segetibacter sp. 3557_3]|uniref:TonB-dependent receptor n=1 Tax=Segetibacter sp. 3557_3 TaxID=2547429 RepID=UPI001058472A|nr:TonB-dependent receptor [Segetibacter sp. 3557_3]TDH23223.1 TonB-dependent receptor [Segetibacter sp. 3557_3]
MKKIMLALSSCFLLIIANAQKQTISGRITDDDGQSLPSTSVIVKSTRQGTYTDNNGRFKLTGINSLPVTLMITSLGYVTHEEEVNNTGELLIKLKPYIGIEPPVVLASKRVPTKILESPVSIERMGVAVLEATPSVSPYDAIANLKGVDFTTSSFTFKTPSTRGFNGSGSARVNQLLDGMDNQAPGLNFSVGNFVSATQLDVDNIELLPGASSALYGPGGMNGTILINSKNPFVYQGLSVLLKQGIMNVDKRQRPDITGFNDWSIRWAKVLGSRFAFKIGVQYIKAKDWLATDSSNYGRIGDAGGVIAGSRNTDPNYDGVNVYGDETTVDIKPFIPAMYQSFFPQQSINVSRTGYAERDIIDPVTKNLKLSGAIHYKVTPNIEASLSGFYGTGNSVYTGSDRYSLNGIKIGQYKLELRSANWFVRGYTTQENAGQSYASTTLTRRFNEEWKPSTTWYGQYVNQFVQARLTGSEERVAHERARSTADAGRPEPGSAAFNQVFDKLKAIPISQGGGLFLDRSDLWMAEGQYSFSKLKFVELVAGANYKQYVLNSQGTIFIDTAGKIGISEVGAYAQATKKFLNNRLTLSASGRIDKNENFKGKITPRYTALVKVAEDNNIRVSYQTAYRFPTTQQQLIKLQVGSNIYLLGGLPWINTLLMPKGQTSYAIREGKVTADPYVAKEFKPETCNSFELGYRGLIEKKLLIDVYGYISNYRNFIGRSSFYEPQAKTIYSIVVNSENRVKTTGYGIGLNYLLAKNFTASTNFYSDRITDVPGGFIANFNTPKYRLNLGLSNNGFGKDKKLGFAVQYKWQDAFFFENEFGNGNIDAFSTLDAQVSYKWLKNKSQLRLGGTNILNKYYRNGFANPETGGLYYLSVRFDIL